MGKSCCLCVGFLAMVVTRQELERFVTGPESMLWSKSIFARRVLTLGIEDWDGDGRNDMLVNLFNEDAPGIKRMVTVENEYWMAWGRCGINTRVFRIAHADAVVDGLTIRLGLGSVRTANVTVDTAREHGSGHRRPPADVLPRLGRQVVRHARTACRKRVFTSTTNLPSKLHRPLPRALPGQQIQLFLWRSHDSPGMRKLFGGQDPVS